MRQLTTALAALAVAASAFAAHPPAVPVCSWDRPGADPYTGTAAAALARYDMPEADRAALARKIAANDYYRIVGSTREGVTGYRARRNMTFGRDRMCATVTTDRWADDEVQLGFVFVSGEQHVVKWFVCGNLEQLTPEGPASPPPAARHPTEWWDAPPAPGGSSTPEPGQGVVLPPAGESSPPALAAGGTTPLYPAIGTYSAPPGGFCPLPSAPIAPVPEPGTWALLVAGVALLSWWRALRR